MGSCRCRRTLALPLFWRHALRAAPMPSSDIGLLSVRASRRAGHIIIARPPTAALPYFTDHIA
jgi:hypothetical protein